MLSIKEIKGLSKQKKARDVQGLFVTEGKKLFLEAPEDRIVQVLMTREFAEEHPDLVARIPAGVPALLDMERGRFMEVADTRAPQGVLTVVRKEEPSMEAYLAGCRTSPFFLLLENLQDPGNAGTILRTAEAAGVDAVFVTEGSVDLYAPKTIRATMGSIYRVPHFYVPDAFSFLKKMSTMGVTSYAAHLRGTSVYTDCTFSGGTLLIIGNEGNGITDVTADAADVLMKIPMAGRVEALNAAMAAGILMYEVRRQRNL